MSFVLFDLILLLCCAGVWTLHACTDDICYGVTKHVTCAPHKTCGNGIPGESRACVTLRRLPCSLLVFLQATMIIFCCRNSICHSTVALCRAALTRQRGT